MTFTTTKDNIFSALISFISIIPYLIREEEKKRKEIDFEIQLKKIEETQF